MKKKGLFQKSSMVMGILCEIASLGCLVMLIITSRELGMEHLIPASYLACTFFFFTCGFVMIYVARSNLPNFSFKESNEQK